MDDVVSRHKREAKELQAKITALKKSVPQGDKKKKKQVMLDVAQLQAEMEQRHELELAEAAKSAATAASPAAETATATAEPEVAAEHEGDGEDAEEGSTGGKKSRAQKRREKKEQEARERARRINDAEPEEGTTRHEMELKAITEGLASLGLKLSAVAPDGNCLFQAVAVQQTQPAVEMRALAAKYMREHADDFIPFLTNADGDMLTPASFASYCDKMETTAVWGGEHEIVALSKALGRPIQTFQAHMPPHTVNEEASGPPLRLSYHRHQYGLGAHYNAVLDSK